MVLKGWEELHVSSISLSTFLLFGWWAVMIVGMIIGALGVHNGSYLCTVSEDEQVFRKPLALRMGSALFGIGMLEAPFALASNARSWFALIFLLAPCFIVGCLFLKISGPDELRLNFVERTYHRSSGWPFLSTACSGPLTNMYGVYIGVFGSTSGSTYFVGVQGAKLGGRLDLGRFDARPAAEQFANEIASILGLPRTNPPKPLVPAE